MYFMADWTPLSSSHDRRRGVIVLKRKQRKVLTYLFNTIGSLFTFCDGQRGQIVCFKMIGSFFLLHTIEVCCPIHRTAPQNPTPDGIVSSQGLGNDTSKTVFYVTMTRRKNVSNSSFQL